MLAALYTDSNAYSAVGRMVTLLSKAGLRLGSFNRMMRRNPNIPKEKVYSNDKLSFKLLKNQLFKASPYKTMATIFEGSSRQYIKWGTGDAEWLYCMFIENIEFTEYAKKRGLKVIADIYENPYIFEELVKEFDLPELGCLIGQKENIEAQARLRRQYVDRLLAVADEYLIPSSYVADSLRKSPNFDVGKVNIVPYASSLTNKEYCNHGERGRIIWVGNDPVRKGLAYAVRAVERLKKEYGFIDLRVIGPVPEELRGSEYYKNVTFLGYLNKAQLSEEFQKADMFVFPTLAEGFAGVLLEAASFGVPIITTRASGFEDGFPGIFVKERDVEGIVDAVKSLIEDRELRSKMSHDFFEFSKGQNAETFGNGLMEIIGRNTHNV